jgi:hypothetical protein
MVSTPFSFRVLGVHAVLQVAEQLFPGHVVLQLATPLRTSSLQARLLQAANSSTGVLVVLGPAAAAAAGKPGLAGSLIVDVPIRPRSGGSLVLATPAALAAAAAGVEDVADGGQQARLAQLQLRRSQLLPVRCRTSKSGTFIEARWAAAIYAWMAYALKWTAAAELHNFRAVVEFLHPPLQHLNFVTTRRH